MGEYFESKVRDLSAKGLGVVDHPNGQIFFVQGAWPGDEGTFEVLSVEKRYGFAKLKTLSKPSNDRVESPCAFQGYSEKHCGGCSWIIANYPSQLFYKQKFVRNFLDRAGLNQSKVHEIWGSPKQFGYRNRAQFKTNGQRLGFVALGSNQLVDITDCLILTEKVRSSLTKLREKLPADAWKPAEGHDWNFIDVDEDFNSALTILNQRRPFRQGNTKQNQQMQTWLKEKLRKHAASSKVLELFCGSGNFTKIISDGGFVEICAADIIGPAIEKLQAQNLPRTTALDLDIFKPSNWNKLKKIISKPEILILDPPRAGFKSVDTFARNFPSLKTIYYISCDLNCFVQEVRSLVKQDWHLQEVQPLDQFPNTPHVEILAVLERQSST